MRLYKEGIEGNKRNVSVILHKVRHKVKCGLDESVSVERISFELGAHRFFSLRR